ncbi:fungal-specific transcription factor domain-containing protein [Mycena filopes]|nr:fungal-specific transcription factor domain-containing protein [Mycena filopes]
MSSTEHLESSPRAPDGTRGRRHRPCDMCRRKRRRCDGDVPCRQCLNNSIQCISQQSAMPRISAATGRVRVLQARIQTLESLLQSDIVSLEPSQGSATPNPEDPAIGMMIQVIRGLNKPFSAPHSDDLTFDDLSKSLQSLSVDNSSFQGKSSQAMLIKEALDLKRQPLPASASRGAPKAWRINPLNDYHPHRQYHFPRADLIASLISHYFSNVNLYFPLLHRPTFDKSFAGEAHLHDDGFARILLLVCALGSLYSDDPAVQMPSTPSNTAGWRWFDQVDLTVRGQPTLYDIQCYCLAAQFLERTSGPHACWTLVGFGIRLAQDIGAHRATARRGPPTPEQELKKRAFWIMLILDAHCSATLGRTTAIPSSDFDLDHPIPCDDRYWEPSAIGPAFRQPANMPSTVDYLICQLNLNRILSFTLDILYSTNRMKSLLGLGNDNLRRIVIELDSALNTWLDSVPAHLRWDPTRETDIFFAQSASLSCNYSWTRIYLHRQFIPAIGRAGGPPCPPSRVICNNAARACSHVAEIQQKRSPQNPLVFAQTAVFTAGIVLLLQIWGSPRSGSPQSADLLERQPPSDMDDLLLCCVNFTNLRGRDTLEQLVKIDHSASVKSSKSDKRAGVTSTFSTPVQGSAVPPWPLQSNPQHDYIPGSDAAAHVSSQDRGGGDMDMDLDAWSAPPTGFEASEWDSYLSAINEIIHEMPLSNYANQS